MPDPIRPRFNSSRFPIPPPKIAEPGIIERLAGPVVRAMGENAGPYMALATRIGGGLGSGIIGAVPSPVTSGLAAIISGGTEALAQQLEAPDKPFNKSHIAAETALGAIPMARLYKAGKLVRSAIAGGGVGLTGVGARRVADVVSGNDPNALTKGITGDELLQVGLGAGSGAIVGKLGGKTAEVPPPPKPGPQNLDDFIEDVGWDTQRIRLEAAKLDAQGSPRAAHGLRVAAMNKNLGDEHIYNAITKANAEATALPVKANQAAGKAQAQAVTLLEREAKAAKAAAEKARKAVIAAKKDAAKQLADEAAAIEAGKLTAGQPLGDPKMSRRVSVKNSDGSTTSIVQKIGAEDDAIDDVASKGTGKASGKKTSPSPTVLDKPNAETVVRAAAPAVPAPPTVRAPAVSAPARPTPKAVRIAAEASLFPESVTQELASAKAAYRAAITQTDKRSLGGHLGGVHADAVAAMRLADPEFDAKVAAQIGRTTPPPTPTRTPPAAPKATASPTPPVTPEPPSSARPYQKSSLESLPPELQTRLDNLSAVRAQLNANRATMSPETFEQASQAIAKEADTLTAAVLKVEQAAKVSVSKGGVTLGAGLGGSEGIMDIIRSYPEFAANLIGSAGGAAIGAAVNPEKPYLGATVGAGVGFGSAKAAKALAKNNQTVVGAGAALARLLPNIQRFNYLTDPVRLAYNATLAPFGAGNMGSIERIGTGLVERMLPGNRQTDALKQGVQGLKELWSPRMIKDYPESLRTAGKRIDDAARGEHLLVDNPTILNHTLSGPGRVMGAGDDLVRKALIRAGMSDEMARRITVTGNPRTKIGEVTTNISKSGGAVGAFIAPFTRTAVNVMESSIERAPIIGLFGRFLIKDPAARATLSETIMQQGLGAGVGYAAYELGKNIDPETVTKYRLLTLVPNMAGQYGAIAAAAFAAGQVARAGGDSTAQLKTGARSVTQGMPLPEMSPVLDLGYAAVNLGHRQPVNPEAEHFPERWIPKPFLPSFLKDQVLDEISGADAKNNTPRPRFQRSRFTLPQ